MKDWNCPPSLPLAGSALPAIGDALFAVGNPEGLEGTFSDGIVSGIRSVATQKLLQITAPISPGSSGGPVLSSSGRVFGIAEATLREGQNLNFAVPAEHIAALLAKALSVVTPLSALATPPNSDSTIAKAGPDLLSGVSGGQFMWSDRTWALPSAPYRYSFTVVNHLSSAIKDIDLLVIFYDSDWSPVDSDRVRIAGPIFPGAAKRVYGAESQSIEQLAGEWIDLNTAFLPDNTRVKFRVLNFGVVQ